MLLPLDALGFHTQGASLMARDGGSRAILTGKGPVLPQYGWRVAEGPRGDVARRRCYKKKRALTEPPFLGE